MKPLFLSGLLASAVVALPAAGEIIERVVANVHGEILTLSEFEARQVSAVQQARVRPEDVERFLRENNQRILQEAIDDLLLVQRARELGLRVRAEYVDEIIEGIKKDNNIATEEQFQEQLRREGLSVDELRRNIERSVVRRQLLQRELEGRATVSEAEALAEFQANKDRYGQPASVQLQEIVVEGDDAQTRAAVLAARARSGEDFAVLAREYSAAPTAAEGGDLGRVVRGELNPALEAAAFALPQGGVSDPLPATNGWRVLRVAAKTEAQAPSFETARALIIQRLTQERMAEQYESYVEQLRADAGKIDVRVREVPLQVTVPVGPSLAPAAGDAGAPSASDEEIVTTPQAQPERVTPEPLPGRGEPQPAVSPTPPPGA